MLFFIYAKFKLCESGSVLIYVMPFAINFDTGQMPGFFILGRKIMEEQESNIKKTKNIYQNTADLYESLYDGE